MIPDEGALRAAQALAVRALRGWHFSEGRDVTEFEGYSLAGLSRMDAAVQLARLFRQAAQGRDPDSPDFFADGQDEKYGPMPDFSLGWRRTDARAAAFRAAYRVLRAFRSASSKKSVLLIGASSNRLLWQYWFEHSRTIPFQMDFALRYPPGIANGFRAIRLGSRVFDPAPRPLTKSQIERIEAIRSDLKKLVSNPDWRELFKCAGQDLSGLFSSIVMAPFLKKLEDLAQMCIAYQTELLTNKPDLIIVPQDGTPEMRLLLAISRKHGVPVWHLEHGFGNGGYTLEEVLATGDLEADLILVWSEGDKLHYLKAGVPEERLAVSGLPSFDRFFPSHAPRPMRSVKGASVMLLSYVRLFGTTLYYDDNEERFFADAARTISKLGAAKILFKLHGGIARLDFYRALITRLKLDCPVEIYHTEPFLDVLAKADAAVGPASTAIFETLLSGKDYYLLHYDPTEIPTPFETSNSFVATSVGQLETNLNEHNSVPRERILKDYCQIAGDEKPWHFTNRLFNMISRELSDSQA